MEILIIIVLSIFFGAFNKSSTLRKSKDRLSSVEKFIIIENMNKK